MSNDNNKKRPSNVRDNISKDDIERGTKLIFESYLHRMVKAWVLGNKAISKENKELCEGYIDRTERRLAKELLYIVYYEPDPEPDDAKRPTEKNKLH